MNPFRDHFPSMAFGRVPETESREEGVYSWILTEYFQRYTKLDRYPCENTVRSILVSTYQSLTSIIIWPVRPR